MFRRFSFWINGSIVLMLLTAVFHSISFFVPASPANDTEKQLLHLATSYKPDAGMGFHPSLMQLFTGLSTCFTLLCLFGALLNGYFLKKQLAAPLWKGLLLIEMIIFGSLFIVMLVFTFPPPVFCTLLVWIFVTAAYFTCSVNNK